MPNQVAPGGIPFHTVLLCREEALPRLSSGIDRTARANL